MTTGLWDRETFVENLRAIGARAYHDKHPFHVAMNEGQLSPEALRGWVANRFYYQRNIPIKDAAILSNCPVREVRRIWIHRILDHDGIAPNAVESAVLSGESAATRCAGDSAHYSNRVKEAASKHGCDLVKHAGCGAPSSWIIATCNPAFDSQWMRT